MLRDPMGYLPVGYIDDDTLKREIRLHGLPVQGPVSELPTFAKKWAAEVLIIAAPSATPAELREVVESCVETGLPFQVLPSTEEVLAGQVGAGQLREVKLDDLLGRDPIQLALPQLGAELDGKTVLITGAAGSIGSEISRQVALNRPGRLVLMDKNESELYYVDLDLCRKFPDLEIVAVVGDLLDETLLKQVFSEETPDVVFHAAAYKHVPLMERNARSAVLNNVLGTSFVAELAGRSGAERFVLISTDKAVEPANVMGATKRAAEFITLDCSERYPATWFTAVRFGNVLGSRGSVVPVFERQLAAGQPLTVTHPEVTRYFMTIPEAVQLVLQASMLRDARGRITMLDMGEPVLILDLARKLIRLKGLREGVDAHIEFCGLRPGEKLHERLSSPLERAEETEVRKIRIVASSAADYHDDMSLVALLGRLREGQATSHESAVKLLCEIVPEFGKAVRTVPQTQLASA
jgi:FlaA1/EpsC-like NDP-sugar epimerase